MKVKFYSYIRDYTRCKAVEVSGYSTIRELLFGLCELYEKKLQDTIFKEGELSNEVIILVNGRNIYFLDQLKTSINEDDEVTIFPVVAGG